MAYVEIKWNAQKLISDASYRFKMLENALQEFKKQIKKEGLMQELRKREHYLPPSKAKRVKKNNAIKSKMRDIRKQEWYQNKNEL